MLFENNYAYSMLCVLLLFLSVVLLKKLYILFNLKDKINTLSKGWKKNVESATNVDYKKQYESLADLVNESGDMLPGDRKEVNKTLLRDIHIFTYIEKLEDSLDFKIIVEIKRGLVTTELTTFNSEDDYSVARNKALKHSRQVGSLNNYDYLDKILTSKGSPSSWVDSPPPSYYPSPESIRSINGLAFG